MQCGLLSLTNMVAFYIMSGVLNESKPFATGRPQDRKLVEEHFQPIHSYLISISAANARGTRLAKGNANLIFIRFCQA